MTISSGERLWRSVNNECITPFENESHLKQAINLYFRHYNEDRFHQGHDYQTPDEVYYQQPIPVAVCAGYTTGSEINRTSKPSN